MGFRYIAGMVAAGLGTLLRVYCPLNMQLCWFAFFDGVGYDCTSASCNFSEIVNTEFTRSSIGLFRSLVSAAKKNNNNLRPHLNPGKFGIIEKKIGKEIPRHQLVRFASDLPTSTSV